MIHKSLRAKKVNDHNTNASESFKEATNVSKEIEHVVNTARVHMQLWVHLYNHCRLIRFLPRIKRLVTLMKIEQLLLVRVKPTWIEEKLIRVDPVLSQLIDVRSAFQILQDVIETLLNRF